jgi:hypothetical protein
MLFNVWSFSLKKQSPLGLCLHVLQGNRFDVMKSDFLDLSKENVQLREEIKRTQTERDKELAEKSALEKENKRMAGQLKAFGVFQVINRELFLNTA